MPSKTKTVDSFVNNETTSRDKRTSLSEIIKLEMCLVYKQTFDIPMGSPLSPIVSDIVMQDLEIKALQRLPILPSFYVRYVDDK